MTAGSFQRYFRSAYAKGWNKTGYSVLGAATLEPDDDYPQYAFAVGREVASDSSRRGILFCRSGAGMAIAANKVVGIRAVAAHSVDEVKHAREHDDANVLTIAADWLRAASVEELLRAFLTTEGAVAPRHVRRIQQISEYELQSE